MRPESLKARLERRHPQGCKHGAPGALFGYSSTANIPASAARRCLNRPRPTAKYRLIIAEYDVDEDGFIQTTII